MKQIGHSEQMGHVTHNSGTFAWLNDIEVCKVAYFISFPLMILNLILIRQPFFEIIIPQMGARFYTLHEVGNLSVLEAGVLVFGGASILLLLVPVLKSFEWKYKWFLPGLMISVVECVAVLFFLIKKNELMNSTLIGAVYGFLSIEIQVTAAAWALLITNLLILVCMVKIIFDIRSNYVKYQLPLMQI